MSFGELKLDTFNYGSMSPMGGSNPFGNAATGFVGDIFSGKNFYDAAGERINQMGQQVAAQAMNSVFDAVGGAIGGALGSISIGAEKSKNAKAKSESQKANAETKAAADNGVNKAKQLLQEIDGKVAVYDTQILDLTTQLQQAQELAGQQEKQIKENLVKVQGEIAEYKLKKAEREALETLINEEEDENKKAQLQEQLKAKDSEIEGLTTGINNIQAELDTIRTTLEDAKAVAANNAEQVTELQENAQADSENAQANITQIGNETTTAVNNGATRAAQSASTEQANGAGQIQKAEMMAAKGGLLSATGFGAVVGGKDVAQAAILKGIGTEAKASGIGNYSSLTANITNFAGQIQGLGSSVEATNLNFTNLGYNIETFTANTESFNTFVDELIANTTIYDVQENDKKDEKKEAKVA